VAGHRVTARLPEVAPPRRVRPFPFQSALLPHVHERDEDQPDEHDHFDQPEQSERAKRDGPRVEEDRFDVEDDEQHRHHVELDREPGGLRQADRLHPRLVGRHLDRIWPVRSEQRRKAQRQDGEPSGQNRENDDRNETVGHRQPLGAMETSACISLSFFPPLLPSVRFAMNRSANSIALRRGKPYLTARCMNRGWPIIRTQLRPIE
jgi:hypothetical protein